MTRTALIISVLVFTFCCTYLYQLGAHSPPDASRDAMMLRRHVDSTRTIHLRTDFPSFYYAAKGVGMGKSIYTAKSLDSLAAADGVANHVLPYLYPPFLAIVAQPLASVAPVNAQRVWDVVQAVLFSVALVVLVVTRPFAAAGTPGRACWIVGAIITCAGAVIFPFQQNIVFGQVNSLVLFLISLCLFLSCYTKYEWLAGGLLAVATLVKVTPALLAVFFLLNKKWKVLGGFVGALALLVPATFPLAGTEAWLEFLAFLPNMGYARNVAGGFHPSIVANFSLAGFFMRLLPGEATLVGILTITCTVVLLGVLLYHHVRPNSNQRKDLLLPYLVLMVVASPVTWLHHLVYVFPGVVFTLRSLLLELRGTRRLVGVVLLSSLAGLSVVDFQALYPSLTISEALRPFVTSMNLWFLILLFAASLIFTRRSS